MKNLIQSISVMLVVIFLSSCTPPPENGQKPNESFLLFSDASPCQDYGSLSNLESQHLKIFRIPFLTRIKYEDHVNSIVYPKTREKIDVYFYTKLKSRYELVDYRSLDSIQLSKIRVFRDSVLSHILNGKETPLKWGYQFPLGIFDSTAIIYLPVGIERESAEHVQARFYALLINSNGEVIFCKCMSYSADKWSSDIDSFTNDVENKLPLLEKQ